MAAMSRILSDWNKMHNKIIEGQLSFGFYSVILGNLWNEMEKVKAQCVDCFDVCDETHLHTQNLHLQDHEVEHMQNFESMERLYHLAIEEFNLSIKWANEKPLRKVKGHARNHDCNEPGHDRLWLAMYPTPYNSQIMYLWGTPFLRSESCTVNWESIWEKLKALISMWV